MATPSTVLTSSDIEGVYTPVVTPFHEDETIDDVAFAAALDRQVEAGIAGIVVGGTTGEYYAMTLDERREQLAAAATIAGDRVKLVAGCTTGATRDTISLARHAQEHGYQAIMLSPPPTSLPSQSQLAGHLALAAGEGGLPIILYNYPARAGVEIGFDCLDAIADRPDIIAMKESSGDFSRFLAARDRYAGRIEIMCGTDDQAFDYMMWGVRSWLAGPANVFPAEHVRFVEAMLAGRHQLGRDLYAAMLPYIQHLETGNYNAKVKAGMSHRGVAAGTVRRPMTPLTETENAELAALIDRCVGAYESASVAAASGSR